MDKKPIDLPTNTLIGAWRVLQLLGRGGQGAVWSAKPIRPKHSPQRALKACFADDPKARARFVREVEMLGKCESPHVLRVYAADVEWKEHVPGVPPFAYYVAEKCDGSIEERRDKLGGLRQRLMLFRQACAAVTKLHSMSDPIIHRDLKPANFLITNELGSVVLADFGIARAVSSSDLTEAFEVVGTPYYRAPEVHHGDRGSVRSDIYGMGRVLEWLVTDDVSKDMLTRRVRRGAELDDLACDLLDRVVLKATQSSPVERFGSIGELVEQLPDLWLTIRPRARTETLPVTSNAPSVVETAIELARKPDYLGWHQLEDQQRRTFVSRLAEWRVDAEPKWRDRHKETAFPTVEKLFEVAQPRMLMSLIGVYSRNPALVDQRSLLDDLAVIPDWKRDGRTAIVEAPRTLAYLFHYLHGALCMATNQADLAIQLAEKTFLRARTDKPEPLWEARDITGWPSTLGGDCTWAWEYLVGLRQRFPLIQQLFALSTDFEIGLTSYSMLLSLLELATDCAKSSPPDLSKTENVRLAVPPMFAMQSHEAVTVSSRRVFGNATLVASVAQHQGAALATMKDLWPLWSKLIANFHAGVTNGFADPLPLGALG